MAITIVQKSLLESFPPKLRAQIIKCVPSEKCDLNSHGIIEISAFLLQPLMRGHYILHVGVITSRYVTCVPIPTFDMQILDADLLALLQEQAAWFQLQPGCFVSSSEIIARYDSFLVGTFRLLAQELSASKSIESVATDVLALGQELRMFQREDLCGDHWNRLDSILTKYGMPK